MRIEGDWVIAETGQDRRLFNLIKSNDQWRHTEGYRSHRNWQAYHFGEGSPYGDGNIPGLLVRRPMADCSQEILAIVKPVNRMELNHFL